MRQSAGLLMYRRLGAEVELFLVHPGGPFFSRRDAGFWSVPKGLFEAGERPLDTARREFAEETGQPVEACAVTDELIPLGSVVQKGGKRVHAWAFEGAWPEGAELRSNTFTLEWPLGSGSVREFPEVDRAQFFPVDRALEKINPAQASFVERLLRALLP